MQRITSIWLKLVLGLSLILGGGSRSVLAYDLTWDGDTATPGVQDGGGNWDTAAVNRWTDGSAYQFWNSANKDRAFFGVTNGIAGIVNLTSPTIIVGGIVFNPPGSGVYTIKQSNAGNSLRLGGTSVITVNADAVISASITNVDGNGFTKDGPAQLTLTDSSATYRNNFSGVVTVNGGTLVLDKHVSSVIDTAITGNLVINSNATVRLGTREQISSTATVTLNQATLDIADLTETIGQLVLNSGAVLGTTGTLSNSAGGDFQLFSGVVTARLGGPAGLVKNSSNAVLLSGTNTYAGPTTINAGVLQLGSNFSIPSGAGRGNVVLYATLDLNGYSPTINGLFGAGTVTSTATNAVTLTVGGNNAGSDFFGLLTDGGGQTTLAKSGSNTFTLTAAQPLSGSVLVTGGALNLTGAASFSNSPLISITAGAAVIVTSRADGALTLNQGQTLRGSGGVAGDVNVAAGGTLSPGLPVGALNISGVLALASNSTTVIELDRAAGAGDSVSGLTGVIYGGALVVTNLGPAQNGGETYQLFAATNYSGAFDTISLPPLPPGVFWTNRLALDGSIAAVTTNPPPSSPVLGLGGAPGGGGVEVTFSGGVGQGYRLWSGTNLSALPVTNYWSVLTNGIFGGGPENFTDAVTTNCLHRFYLITVP